MRDGPIVGTKTHGVQVESVRSRATNATSAAIGGASVSWKRNLGSRIYCRMYDLNLSDDMDTKRREII